MTRPSGKLVGTPLCAQPPGLPFGGLLLCGLAPLIHTLHASGLPVTHCCVSLTCPELGTQAEGLSWEMRCGQDSAEEQASTSVPGHTPS